MASHNIIATECVAEAKALFSEFRQKAKIPGFKDVFRHRFIKITKVKENILIWNLMGTHDFEVN